MTLQADDAPLATAPPAGRSALWKAAEIAPWIIFGPITGVMSGVALRCLRNRQPALAAIWLIANVAIVASIPLVTALLVARS